MPRLTQSTSNTVAPQTTQAVTPVVQNGAATTVTVRAVRQRRRYPLWLLPILLIAVVLSGGELWVRGIQYAYKRALDTAQVSQTKYTLQLPSINGAQYAVAPTGDKFLVRYSTNKESYLEVRRVSGELLWRTKSQTGEPAFSQDGTLLFKGIDAFDAATGKLVTQIPAHRHTDISWDSAGRHAAWDWGLSIQVWEKASNKIRTLATLKTIDSTILVDGEAICSGTQISPDGKWVTTLVSNGRPDESCILLWNLATSDPPRVFPVLHETGGGVGLAFSPDSKSLLYSGGKRNGDTWRGEESWVAAWTVSTGQMVTDIKLLERGLTVAWSPDSRYAVVRGFDAWKVFEIPTGKLVWQAPRQEYAFCNSMTFTTDNKLYFYDDDRKKREWPLKYWDLAPVLKKQGGN